MKTLDEMYQFYQALDSCRSLSAMFDSLDHWLGQLKEVSFVCFLCDDRIETGIESEHVHRLPRVELAALPEEVAVLTDRSALPLSLTERMVGAVCATVPGAYGEPIAAILIRADRPKSFIRRARSLLGLVATKVRERLERTLVHGKALEEPGLNGAATETLSPDSLGRLCNGMSLPMYVRDANGRYLTVNDAFLHRFEYESLESLNQRGNLFVDDDSWHRELSRIANNAGPSGTRNQIRTGSGKIRQVQEHATLVGRHLLAVLFDVSEFHSINEELQVALGEQKTLNERLTATTTMLQKTQATAIKALAKLAEYRDKETGNHLQRICNYMKLIGNRVQRMQPYDFEISEEYVHDLVLSGMLHDIGKVAIPDTILLKQGKLDSSEWTVMRKHPELGWSILNQADRELGEQSFLTLASRIALYHHERFDGAGYPYGITGESIPLSARIAAISDVYDALTSERPYKPAWTHEEAVAEIRQERGHHFDPVLVDIFLELQKEIIEVQSNYSEDPAIVN